MDHLKECFIHVGVSLTPNILGILGWNCLPGANTIAHCEHSKFTSVKVLQHWDQVRKVCWRQTLQLTWPWSIKLISHLAVKPSSQNQRVWAKGQPNRYGIDEGRMKKYLKDESHLRGESDSFVACQSQDLVVIPEIKVLCIVSSYKVVNRTDHNKGSLHVP